MMPSGRLKQKLVEKYDTKSGDKHFEDTHFTKLKVLYVCPRTFSKV